jgi:hypothetical protein
MIEYQHSYRALLSTRQDVSRCLPIRVLGWKLSPQPMGLNKNLRPVAQPELMPNHHTDNLVSIKLSLDSGILRCHLGPIMQGR